MVQRTNECYFLDHVSKCISAELREISLKIHDHPELQCKEHHAHAVLTKYLEGWKVWRVTRSVYGIETAFVAYYAAGSGGPVVSFNAEYDALKGRAAITSSPWLR